MEPRTLQFIAESCHGSLRDAAAEALVHRVSTDSRAVERGDLFVALNGERFDGHDFVEEVFRNGAVAAVVDENRLASVPKGRACVTVKDPRKALGDVARSYRKGFGLRAVAVGGSNGKTSTKEIVASVLRQKLETVWSQASFNNDVGVPVSLLQIESKHRAGVFEVGTNHPGELKPLLEMVQPEIGIITSIGREHLEFFGDVDGVIREEGSMAEVLPAEGMLVMPGEGPGNKELKDRCRGRVVEVGRGAGNDWRIAEASMDEGGSRFVLRAPEAEYSGEYRIKLLGMHQVVNATYGIVVGRELGLGRAEIQRGLDSCAGAKMRLQLKQIGGVQVLDDSYNANADSMEAAIQTLGLLPCRGRRIAVLGDMAEVGRERDRAHEEVGRKAAEGMVDYLIAVGESRAVLAGAARAAGLEAVAECPSADSAGEMLAELVRPGDAVLVKASRSSRLERVVDCLSEKLAPRSGTTS